MTSGNADDVKQLTDRIRADITKGRFGDRGSKMPDRMELAALYQAPPRAAWMALNTLRQAGLIEVRGGHRFVKSRTTRSAPFVDWLRTQIATGELAPNALLSDALGTTHGVDRVELREAIATLLDEHLVNRDPCVLARVAPARQVALAYADFALLPSPYGWLCKRADRVPGGEYRLLGVSEQDGPCVAPAAATGRPTGPWVPVVMNDRDRDRDAWAGRGWDAGLAPLIRSLLESESEREPRTADDIRTTTDTSPDTIEVALLEASGELRAWWRHAGKPGLVRVELSAGDRDIVLRWLRLDGAPLARKPISVRERRVLGDRAITVLASGIGQGAYEPLALLIRAAVARGALS